MTESTEPIAPDDTAAPGVERAYAADELFFSATDARGRIRRANAIFMRLSGYPRGALVGRAHSVVRHEAMPAGLFRSIWEDLEQGRAASAYITNRSADGGFYRVFATIVPSGDGYLSVRTLPMLTRRRDEIEAAYGRVRAVERASADGGSTRREAAAAGHSARWASATPSTSPARPSPPRSPPSWPPASISRSGPTPRGPSPSSWTR